MASSSTATSPAPRAANSPQIPRRLYCFTGRSLRRQVRIRGNVSPVTEAEADAYFATPPEAGADRRLGQQAVAAAGKPLRLRAGDRAGRRQTHDRRSAAPARVERLAHSARRASNSGTTVRSVCTTASNSAAMRLTARGPRCGSIPEWSSWPGHKREARLRVGCPAIHDFLLFDEARRGCPAQGRA